MLKIKDIIKNSVGYFYYHAYKKFLSMGNRCLIYHAFGAQLKHDTYGISINIKKFEEHIKYLHNNYQLTEVSDFSKNRLSISLSIDDGYKDTLKAINILDKYKIPFSLFITTTKLDEPGYLSTQDIIDISKIDYANVGTHGLNHIKLATISYNEQRVELAESKRILEKIIKKDIISTSYPHGSYNDDTLKIIYELGYKWAACSKKGFNNILTDKRLLKRSEIIASDTIKSLEKKIKGHYDYY